MIRTKIVKYGTNWQRYCQNKKVAFLAVKNTTKIEINILDGSAATQNVFDGLIMHNLFA